MTPETVTGVHGMAQASEEQVIVLWDACLFFFPAEHLDDIIALLQALQQEIDQKQISLDLKAHEGRKIKRKSGVNTRK